MIILALFPLLAALMGWIVFKIFSLFVLQGLYKKRNSFATAISKAILEEDVHSTIAGFITPEKIKAFEPQINESVATFLDHKLKEKIPVLAMFAGDKIMEQGKTVIVDEIVLTMPNLLQQYANKELNNEALGVLVKEKMTQLSSSKWETWVNMATQPILSKIQIAGTVLGFVLGVLFVLFLFVYAYIMNII